MIKPFTKTEQNRLLNVARQVAKMPKITEEDIESTIEMVVNAQSDRAVRELIESIELQDDAFQNEMWGLVYEFGLIDARRVLSLVEARLATIANSRTPFIRASARSRAYTRSSRRIPGCSIRGGTS